MLTKTQLMAMLKLQDQLNCVINPSWLQAGYPWHRAIMVEAVELLDHVGWKWWKHQEPNLAQAKLELVDIWHFVLSRKLDGCDGDFNDAADDLVYMVDAADRIMSQTTHERIDALTYEAGQGYFSQDAFMGLMQDFGLTWDELYATYIAKNVLNIFRQDHGYRAGSYRKDWLGKEDNEVLDILMKGFPDESPEQLYARLEEVYATVLTAPITP